MAVLKIPDNLISLYIAQIQRGRSRIKKEVEERLNIGAVSSHRIFGQSTLYGQILYKKRQVLTELRGGLQERKMMKRNNPSVCTGVISLRSISQAVELSKFPQGFRCFTAFLYAGFFVVFTPFQLTFNTVDLQFFL